MKCTANKNMYLYAGAFIALVAVYIGLTIMKTTYEGLSNSADTTNVAIVEKTKQMNSATKEVLNSLTSDPTSYINLLISYKNKVMATTIKNTVINKNASAFKNISEYDEVIDYLKTLGVSDTAPLINPDIENVIISNTTETNAILAELTADNQAYIDLLTSHKNKAIANFIKNTTNSTSPNINISSYSDSIEYLRTLGGTVVDNKKYEPTTRNISLANPNYNV
jgi:hypothetical protein